MTWTWWPTYESNQLIKDVSKSIPLEFMYQTKIAIKICKIIESSGQAKEQTTENQENGGYSRPAELERSTSREILSKQLERR
jgi:hypothetical protein